MAVSAELVDHGVGYLCVGGIDLNVIDSAAGRREIMFSPGRAVIRGNKDLAGGSEGAARCSIDGVHIRRSDADRIQGVPPTIESDGSRGGDGGPSVAPIGGFPHMSRAIQNAVSVARVYRERRIEILRVISGHADGLDEPVIACVVGAAEEIPVAEALDRSLMIDAGAIGGTEFGIAAIASVRLRPDWIANVQFGAVILATADHDVGIGRVQPDARELGRGKISVEIGPGRCRGSIQTVDAAIVTIQQLAIRIEVHCVMINVGRSIIRRSAGMNIYPARAAGDRPQNTIGARGPSRIDDGRV
jgi:hypothetical protein